MTDLLCCTPETNTTLEINYNKIKLKPNKQKVTLLTDTELHSSFKLEMWGKYLFLSFFSFFFFWPHLRLAVPGPGIDPGPPQQGQ